MASKINLDEPWLEQQAVKELINVLPGSIDAQANYQAELSELLKIAQTFICDELESLGLTSNELFSLQLECKMLKDTEQNLEETVHSAWQQSYNQEVDEKQVFGARQPVDEKQEKDSTQENLEPLSQISNTLASKLTDRLHEAVIARFPTVQATSLTWQFASLSSRGGCDCTEPGKPGFYRYNSNGKCDTSGGPCRSSSTTGDSPITS